MNQKLAFFSGAHGAPYKILFVIPAQAGIQ